MAGSNPPWFAWAGAAWGVLGGGGLARFLGEGCSFSLGSFGLCSRFCALSLGSARFLLVLRAYVRASFSVPCAFCFGFLAFPGIVLLGAGVL